MLKINSLITKRKLLDNLAECANHKADLVIDIESLPTFLATPIAFTIFTYQISNYPRHIFWTSQDDYILKFLKSCQVDIYEPIQDEAPNNPVQPSATNSSVESLKIFPNRDLIVGQDVEAETKALLPSNTQILETETPEDQPKLSPATLRFQAKDLLKKDNYQPSTLLEEVFQETGSQEQYSSQNSQLQETLEVMTAEKSPEKTPSIDIKRPTSKWSSPDNLKSHQANIYEPETSNINNSPALEGNFEQNLDSWLERIEATRAALSSLKEVEEVELPRKSSLLKRTFQFVVASSLLSILVVGMWFLFPTNAYSIEVTSQKKEATSQLSLAPNSFLVQNRNLNATAEIEGSGKETISLSQARGKITLVNRSSGRVSFNRSGIILVSQNGLEYRHVPVNGEPSTFVVNGGESVTINVEASGSGTNYNLAKGSQLKVYNLKKDLIGGLFQGIVTEEINTTQETGKRLILEEDLKKLAEQTAQKLRNELDAENRAIQAQDIFTDSGWVQIQDIQNTYTRKAGDVADVVGITSSAKAKLFYLNRGVLEDELKTVNPKIKNLLEVVDISYTGDFNQLDNRIEINLTYEYTEKLDLDEEDLLKRLSDEDFQKIETELKKDHPEISQIEKKEQGLRLPGVSARVDITIKEKN